MSAHFEIEIAFALPRRQAVILGGKILSGTVKAGMQAKVQLSSELNLVACVSAVEFILCKGGREIIGLVLDVPDTSTQELWREICNIGDVISIVPAQDEHTGHS